MPRFPRNNLKTSFFHVMVQGINRSYIFEKDVDKKFYLKRIFSKNREFDIEIIAYCVMDNHVHLLLKTEKIEKLSNFMHIVNTIYARYYNKKYNRVGYVYRDRYKSEGIYSEKQLYNCIRYIYDNPVKAKICCNADMYSFSNYNKKYARLIPNKCEYSFMEINHKASCNNIIKDFFIEKKIDVNQIQKDERLIKEISKALKNNYNISLRNIAEYIDISREKLRRIYKTK